jgi:hypothetical protein
MSEYAVMLERLPTQIVLGGYLPALRTRFAWLEHLQLLRNELSATIAVEVRAKQQCAVRMIDLEELALRPLDERVAEQALHGARALEHSLLLDVPRRKIMREKKERKRKRLRA